MKVLNTRKTLKEQLEECFGTPRRPPRRPPWVHALNRDGKTVTSGFHRDCGSGIIKRVSP